MWGGSDVWVRGQGEAIGKAVWYHSRWSSASKITIEWDGMTADEKEENRVWCDAFIEESNKPSEKGKDTDVEGSDTMEDHITKMEEQLDAERRKCRGGCGAENVNNVCSRCKEVCKSPLFIFTISNEPLIYLLDYCGLECQKDDWKVWCSHFFSDSLLTLTLIQWHKSVCGKDTHDY